ncbi:hypothetical protein SDC9_42107 [bioreactor metagenome]|uniref:Uncharacterized protein n=1 Tax=bioreactor metagenome TaxID=1076179 RepID=A0A644VWT7_9ZZZZ
MGNAFLENTLSTGSVVFSDQDRLRQSILLQGGKRFKAVQGQRKGIFTLPGQECFPHSGQSVFFLQQPTPPLLRGISKRGRHIRPSPVNTDTAAAENQDTPLILSDPFFIFSSTRSFCCRISHFMFRTRRKRAEYPSTFQEDASFSKAL